MFSKLVPIVAVAFLAFSAAPSALACDDNSDVVVAKLQKLNLSTDQLKSIFAYHKEHKAFISKSHRDGSGCLAHERNAVSFEKQAVGVLDNQQFKKVTGRDQNETESLRYQNYVLKTELEKLKKEIEALKAAIESKKSV